MLKKTFLLTLLFAGVVLAKQANVSKHDGRKVGDRINFPMRISEVWSYSTNYGCIGGEAGSQLDGYSWPGGASVNNYYLWLSYFWVGVQFNGDYFVTWHDYVNPEWGPSEDFVSVTGPGKSAYDVLTAFDDFASSNTYNSSGRHLGLKVIMRALSWPHEPFNDFIGHEFYIIYNKAECDLPGGAPDVLDSLMVAWAFDADVCGGDQSDPHIDDLVAFDGWTNGEWANLSFYPSPTDLVTLLPDSSIDQPDGVYDQYVIWGDEPEWEPILDSSLAVDYTRNDTTYKVYIFPRGMSYIYDGDNPADPGDDTGENGMCAGYIGGAWIYAPPSPSDSIIVNGSDTARIIRPWSHQWWNWENDPPTDEDQYKYMLGIHPATAPYRYAPHPFDMGAATFDYRFLISVGPFSIADGETLKFVYIGAVGQGLNGDVDSLWRGNAWVRGLRQDMDWAIKAYYAGSQYSDPFHPSAPDEDDHWKIPIPPPSPELSYRATPSGVQLVWNDEPEMKPDPIKARIDFVSYRVYRSVYNPQNWELIAEFTRDPQTNLIAHTFVDTTAVPGFPYYYVVTAMDEDSLESPKSNYLKDCEGNPVSVTMPTREGSLDDVIVVPNPYYGSAPWTATEIADKIEFQNLPPSCDIKIFTMSGDLVRELKHNDGTGSEAWNLLSKNDQKVVSGVYIYKITTPDGEYKVGKFMIIK